MRVGAAPVKKYWPPMLLLAGYAVAGATGMFGTLLWWVCAGRPDFFFRSFRSALQVEIPLFTIAYGVIGFFVLTPVIAPILAARRRAIRPWPFLASAFVIGVLVCAGLHGIEIARESWLGFPYLPDLATIALVTAACFRCTRPLPIAPCVNCGYDLQGNLGVGCPECGWNRATIQ